MTYEEFEKYAESVGCKNIQYGKIGWLNDDLGKDKHGVNLILPNGHPWTCRVIQEKKTELDVISTEFYTMLKDTLKKLSIIN